MSHLQGTDYVGSMVVFEDGLAKKSDYRKFKVKTVAGNDDYAAMEEVLTRRLRPADRRRWASTDGAGATTRTEAAPAARRFAYPPQLLLLDGGKGQLGVGERVVAALGLRGEIELAALAKQFEEVYRPGSPDPVRDPPGLRGPLPAPAGARRGPPLRRHLPPPAPGQAHDGQRARRRGRAWARPAGTRLLKEVGGVRALRAATPEDLRSLGWLPDRVADAVYEALHGVPAPAPATVPADGDCPPVAAPMGETGGR